MSEKKDVLNVIRHEPKKKPSGRDLAPLIAQRIRQLPEFHRKVLALYYQEGLRLNEIAEATGVCQSLVRQVHNLAMEEIIAVSSGCSELAA